MASNQRARNRASTPGRRGAPRLHALRLAVGLLTVAAALLGVVELLAVLAGPLRPTWVAYAIPLTATAYVGLGVVAWLRRPSSSIGALLIFGGLAWIATGFGNTTIPALIALGAIIATMPLAVMVQLLVGFPSGRLTNRSDKVLVIAAYFVAVVLQAPLYLFAANPPPYDALQISDHPGLVDAGIWTQRAMGIAVMAITSALLIRRLGKATPSQRWVLIPLYIYGTAAILFIPLSAILVAPNLGWSPVTEYVVQLSVAALVPVAFGWSIMRGGFARTAEVEELGAWLGAEERARAALRRALADTLGDPSLGLVFWVPDRGGYVDGDGRPAPPPVAGARRAVSEIALAGRRVGAITFDQDAVADPELVRTAGRVVALAVDRERLTAELLANQEALRQSRQRIVEAGDRERRRVERNLHDGAQQRMMAVAMELRMIESNLDGTDPATRSLVAQAANDLDGAMGELRELARGLHPTLLTDVGLDGALESLAERSAIPVHLSVHLANGLPDTTAVGAYYVVAEALTNAARHSCAERIDVRAALAGGGLRIEVVDDGVGGAEPVPGSGLEGLLDRVDSLGGQLRITSPAGAGTTIVAELPCA